MGLSKLESGTPIPCFKFESSIETAVGFVAAVFAPYIRFSIAFFGLRSLEVNAGFANAFDFPSTGITVGLEVAAFAPYIKSSA